MIASTAALFVLVLSPTCTTAVDDFYSIFLPQKSSSTGMGSCYKASSRTRSVRLYSMVSSAGNEFVRQNVPDDILSSCIQKGTTVLKASTIVACLNAADKAGMGTFTFANGVCTGYTGWHMRGPASCATGTNLVYVKKKYTSPFPAGVNATLQYTFVNFLSAGVIILNPILPCGYESYFGAKVVFGNNQTVIAKSNATQVTVPRKVLCFYPQNITVWSITANGTSLALQTSLQLNISEHFWFGMPNGGCFFHGSIESSSYINHTTAQTYCRSVGLDIYSQTTNSRDTAAIIKALSDQVNIIPYQYTDIHIDLTYDAASRNFIWRGGQISNTSDSSIWSRVNDVNNDPYAVFMATDFLIRNFDLFEEGYTPSCYDPNP